MTATDDALVRRMRCAYEDAWEQMAATLAVAKAEWEAERDWLTQERDRALAYGEHVEKLIMELREKMTAEPSEGEIVQGAAVSLVGTVEHIRGNWIYLLVEGCSARFGVPRAALRAAELRAAIISTSGATPPPADQDLTRGKGDKNA
jgi:hypothetical protein